jgi:hypothetical protein
MRRLELMPEVSYWRQLHRVRCTALKTPWGREAAGHSRATYVAQGLIQSCPRLNLPFAELVCLSPTTIDDEMRKENALGGNAPH